jgi:Fe/S biogenesis protein NfuA
METAIEPIIHLSKTAEEHFSSLLKKENIDGLSLRMEVINPNTKNVDINIVYCSPGKHAMDDLKLEFADFFMYLDNSSIEYLKDAQIDYEHDDFGGKLLINAPQLAKPTLREDADLLEKVKYYMETEINPSLASHKGHAEVISVDAENNVYVKFGGGCHGCGMASYTLKQGIEKGLKEHIPEIKAVLDATDHSNATNPYY